MKKHHSISALLLICYWVSKNILVIKHIDFEVSMA